MYIFRRTSTLKPDHMLDGLAYAVEIAARVTTVIGREVSVYNTTFGAPFGTVNWTIRVESLSDLEDLVAKLGVDSGYLEAVQSGSAMFSTLPSDSVLNIVSSTFEGTPQRYVGVTQAVPTDGKIIEAVTWGVKVQTHCATSGRPTAFGTSPFGPFGAVAWLVGGSSMADVDTFQQFISTDATFATMLSEGGGLFQPGTAHNTLIERIN